ncbi:MAG TPA: ribosome recycling factor [Arachidicoccus sp.]|nr:ribosome recycling factor [Arachidicoccus sp.]
MSESIESILKDAEAGMKKSMAHLDVELSRIRAGKASPSILEGVMAEYYGNPTPIAQVANISVMDARTIIIQPWEKNMLSVIERAIMAANIGLTPQNDGVQIRLFMPPLTEERRRELFKKATAEGENGKISVRSLRRDSIEQIKKLQKDGLSEDIAKGGEKEVQDLTDRFIGQIDKVLAGKEKEIMEI